MNADAETVSLFNFFFSITFNFSKMKNKNTILEVWKAIPNFERYLASNLGNIKSLNYMNTGVPSLLKQYVKKDGYHTVALCKNGRLKRFDVQVLVAMAFLDHVPCGHLMEVDHKNRDNGDNRVDNLQILTGRRHRMKTKEHVGENDATGVSLVKLTKKYRAQIMFNKRIVHLGTFENKADAEKAYKKALIMIENDEYNPPKLHVPTSKHKGVCWHKATKKWIATSCANSKKKHLGVFNTEQEAFLATLKQ